MLQEGRTGIPGRVLRAVDHVVAQQRRDRDGGDVRDAELPCQGGEFVGNPVVDRRVPTDEVHLVDGQHDVPHTEQPRDREVPAGLFEDAVPSIGEDERKLCGRRPGDHVPGVLHVPRSVGEDVGAGGGREVAVGHVDGDALLPLGAQAVGEQSEVGGLQAPVAAHPLDGGELVGEDRLGVVQEATDKGGLAVVDAPRRGEAQQLVRHGLDGGSHQKYPSFLRSSMAASDNRSSARVAPRSVSREPATSRTTSATVSASESTAPVQLMSPTVR
ncbi:MAG: hypothetical protein BWY91_00893 [bacterium ADurb.BinA028]|nr:MAG: hypothetical protein BWY91_00893 [bacterium ADurb.BinA028]